MRNADLSVTEVERIIHTIRGRRVMLDFDLASVYGVTVKRLNEQVRRNFDRFPPDFTFQLTYQEVTALRSQFATLETTEGRGRHRKYLPYAFTEHGAIMLANVLKSPQAIQASIQVVRAFVRLRELALTHRDLLLKINAMERKYDSQFRVVFDAIRKLMTPPPPRESRKIGFH